MKVVNEKNMAEPMNYAAWDLRWFMQEELLVDKLTQLKHRRQLLYCRQDVDIAVRLLDNTNDKSRIQVEQEVKAAEHKFAIQQKVTRDACMTADVEKRKLVTAIFRLVECQLQHMQQKAAIAESLKANLLRKLNMEEGTELGWPLGQGELSSNGSQEQIEAQRNESLNKDHLQAPIDESPSVQPYAHFGVHVYSHRIEEAATETDKVQQSDRSTSVPTPHARFQDYADLDRAEAETETEKTRLTDRSTSVPQSKQDDRTISVPQPKQNDRSTSIPKSFARSNEYPHRDHREVQTETERQRRSDRSTSVQKPFARFHEHAEDQTKAETETDKMKLSNRSTSVPQSKQSDRATSIPRSFARYNELPQRDYREVQTKTEKQGYNDRSTFVQRRPGSSNATQSSREPSTSPKTPFYPVTYETTTSSVKQDDEFASPSPTQITKNSLIHRASSSKPVRVLLKTWGSIRTAVHSASRPPSPAKDSHSRSTTPRGLKDQGFVNNLGVAGKTDDDLLGTGHISKDPGDRQSLEHTYEPDSYVNLRKSRSAVAIKHGHGKSPSTKPMSMTRETSLPEKRIEKPPSLPPSPIHRNTVKEHSVAQNSSLPNRVTARETSLPSHSPVHEHPHEHQLRETVSLNGTGILGTVTVPNETTLAQQHQFRETSGVKEASFPHCSLTKIPTLTLTASRHSEPAALDQIFRTNRDFSIPRISGFDKNFLGYGPDIRRTSQAPQSPAYKEASIPHSGLVKEPSLAPNKVISDRPGSATRGISHDVNSIAKSPSMFPKSPARETSFPKERSLLTPPGRVRETTQPGSAALRDTSLPRRDVVEPSLVDTTHVQSHAHHVKEVSVPRVHNAMEPTAKQPLQHGERLTQGGRVENKSTLPRRGTIEKLSLKQDGHVEEQRVTKLKSTSEQHPAQQFSLTPIDRPKATSALSSNANNALAPYEHVLKGLSRGQDRTTQPLQSITYTGGTPQHAGVPGHDQATQRRGVKGISIPHGSFVGQTSTHQSSRELSVKQPSLPRENPLGHHIDANLHQTNLYRSNNRDVSLQHNGTAYIEISLAQNHPVLFRQITRTMDASLPRPNKQSSLSKGHPKIATAPGGILSGGSSLSHAHISTDSSNSKQKHHDRKKHHPHEKLSKESILTHIPSVSDTSEPPTYRDHHLHVPPDAAHHNHVEKTSLEAKHSKQRNTAIAVKLSHGKVPKITSAEHELRETLQELLQGNVVTRTSVLRALTNTDVEPSARHTLHFPGFLHHHNAETEHEIKTSLKQHGSVRSTEVQQGNVEKTSGTNVRKTLPHHGSNLKESSAPQSTSNTNVSELLAHQNHFMPEVLQQHNTESEASHQAHDPHGTILGRSSRIPTSDMAVEPSVHHHPFIHVPELFHHHNTETESHHEVAHDQVREALQPRGNVIRDPSVPHSPVHGETPELLANHDHHLPKLLRHHSTLAEAAHEKKKSKQPSAANVSVETTPGHKNDHDHDLDHVRETLQPHPTSILKKSSGHRIPSKNDIVEPPVHHGPHLPEFLRIHHHSKLVEAKDSKLLKKTLSDYKHGHSVPEAIHHHGSVPASSGGHPTDVSPHHDHFLTGEILHNHGRSTLRQTPSGSTDLEPPLHHHGSHTAPQHHGTIITNTTRNFKNGKRSSAVKEDPLHNHGQEKALHEYGHVPAKETSVPRPPSGSHPPEDQHHHDHFVTGTMFHSHRRSTTFQAPSSGNVIEPPSLHQNHVEKAAHHNTATVSQTSHESKNSRHSNNIREEPPRHHDQEAPQHHGKTSKGAPVTQPPSGPHTTESTLGHHHEHDHYVTGAQVHHHRRLSAFRTPSGGNIANPPLLHGHQAAEAPHRNTSTGKDGAHELKEVKHSATPKEEAQHHHDEEAQHMPAHNEKETSLSRTPSGTQISKEPLHPHHLVPHDITSAEMAHDTKRSTHGTTGRVVSHSHLHAGRRPSQVEAAEPPLHHGHHTNHTQEKEATHESEHPKHSGADKVDAIHQHGGALEKSPTYRHIAEERVLSGTSSVEVGSSNTPTAEVLHHPKNSKNTASARSLTHGIGLKKTSSDHSQNIKETPISHGSTGKGESVPSTSNSSNKDEQPLRHCRHVGTNRPHDIVVEEESSNNGHSRPGSPTRDTALKQSHNTSDEPCIGQNHDIMEVGGSPVPRLTKHGSTNDSHHS